VQNVLKSIRRSKGTAPTQKAAAKIAVIRAMVAQLDDSLQGIRDRAILLIGFAGAFRRSIYTLIAAAYRDAAARHFEACLHNVWIFD